MITLIVTVTFKLSSFTKMRNSNPGNENMDEKRTTTNNLSTKSGECICTIAVINIFKSTLFLTIFRVRFAIARGRTDRSTGKLTFKLIHGELHQDEPKKTWKTPTMITRTSRCPGDMAGVIDARNWAEPK